MRLSKVVSHAADTQKGAFNAGHFCFAQRGQRASPKTVAIQCASLLWHDVTRLEQTSAWRNRNPQPGQIFEQFTGQWNAQHRTHTGGKQHIVEHNQHWTHFPDFCTRVWIESCQPDFSALHYFHHCSGSGSGQHHAFARTDAPLCGWRHQPGVAE